METYCHAFYFCKNRAEPLYMTRTPRFVYTGIPFPLQKKSGLHFQDQTDNRADGNEQNGMQVFGGLDE